MLPIACMNVSVQDRHCGFYLGIPSEVAIRHALSILTGKLDMEKIKLLRLGMEAAWCHRANVGLPSYSFGSKSNPCLFLPV